MKTINNLNSQTSTGRYNLAFVFISGLLTLFIIGSFVIPSVRVLSSASSASLERFEMVEAYTGENAEDVKYINKMQEANTAIYNGIKTKGKISKDYIEEVDKDIDLILNNAEYSNMKNELISNANVVSKNLDNLKAIEVQRSYFNKTLAISLLFGGIFIISLIKFKIK